MTKNTESNAEITYAGHTYSAERGADDRVSIYRDGEYAGQGRWDGTGITDCSAELTPGNASTSDEVYSLLDEALAD